MLQNIVAEIKGKACDHTNVAGRVIVLHNNALLIQFNIKWLWQLSSMGFSLLV